MTTHETLSAAPRPMLHALARNWWLLLLRGIFAIIFGVCCFLLPGISLVTLVLLYGVYAFADGIVALAAAISGDARNERWWLALIGILGLAAGLVTLFWPGITALVLLYFIAFWSIAIGIMQIVGAIRLRHEIENEWWLVAAGALSVLLGIILIVAPGAGVLGLLWAIGAYAIAHGITLIMFSLRLRRHTHA